METPQVKAFRIAQAKGDTEDQKLMTAWNKTNDECTALGNSRGGKQKQHNEYKAEAKELRRIEVSQAWYTAEEPLPSGLNAMLTNISDSLDDDTLTPANVIEFATRIVSKSHSVTNLENQKKNNQLLMDIEKELRDMREVKDKKVAHRNKVMETLQERQDQRDTRRPLTATLDSMYGALAAVPKRSAIAAAPEPAAKKRTLTDVGRASTIDANSIRELFVASLTDALTPGEIDGEERVDLIDKQQETGMSDEEFYRIIGGLGWSRRDFQRGKKNSGKKKEIAFRVPLVSPSSSAASSPMPRTGPCSRCNNSTLIEPYNSEEGSIMLCIKCAEASGHAKSA